MPSNTPQPLVTAKIIWVALIFSMLIYVVIAFIAASKEGAPSFEEALRIPPVPILYALAAIMFAASSFVARIFSKRTEFPVDGGATPSFDQSALQALIVRWAFTESVAIFGLVASFVTHQWQLVIPPFVLAMIGFIISYPRSTERV